MPKALDTKTKQRHDPLHVQIQQESAGKLKNRAPKVKEMKESLVVDAKTSKKILKMVKEQQEELAQEQPVDFPEDVESENEYVEEVEEVDENEYEEWQTDAVQLDINPEDQALLEKFMTNEPKKQINLADLIMSKFNDAQQPVPNEQPFPEMNPKVIEVYSK